MRRTFFQELHKAMKENPNIWALTGDLGFGGFDEIEKDFPDRFLNCGASEQAMIGIAAGLAFKGKIVFAYSITPFLIKRAKEQIFLYLNGDLANVKLVGSGRGKDYAHDGLSHWADDIPEELKTLPNIKQLWPESANEIPDMVKLMIEDNKPYFISLKR